MSDATKAALIIPSMTLLRLLRTPMSYTSCNYHVLLWYCGKKTKYDYASLAQQCKPWHFLSSAFPFLAWTLGSTFSNKHIFYWRSKKAGGFTLAAAVLWTLFTVIHPQLFLKVCQKTTIFLPIVVSLCWLSIIYHLYFSLQHPIVLRFHNKI